MRMMTALAFGLLHLTAGQQKPVPPPGERPAGVLVDFRAVAADGTPIADLQPNEVSIRLNGRERQILALRLVRAGGSPLGASAPSGTELPEPYGENKQTSAPGERRIILIVDSDSFRAGGEGPLRQAVNGLLAELSPGDRVMLASLPYQGVRVPLTHEYARVRTAIGTLTGQRKQNETGSEMACRTRRLLETTAGLIEALPQGDAPATVVFFTAGMSGPRRDGLAGLPPGMCQLETRAFQGVATAAVKARASFYVVHPDDLPKVGTGSSTGAMGSENPLEGIEHLAGVTGGDRLPLLGEGNDALKRVARETSAYYVAEVAAERDDVGGEPRRLNVRVNRPGAAVRARAAIAFNAPVPLAPKPATQPTVHQLLLSTLEFAELPLRVTGIPIRAPEGMVAVVAVAETPDTAAALETIAVALIDQSGRTVAQATAASPRDVPAVSAMVVPAGTYRLRAAASDSSGRFGTADVLVNATLTPVASLQLSGLTLGLSRGGSLKPRLEFGAEPLALGSFEIYGVPAAAMTAVLEVSKTLDGPALVTSRVAVERADADRLVATGSLPIGALPAGDYVVRGKVTIEGGGTATVYRTLRKR